MISKENIAIVKSTVPVLETQIHTITQAFYKRLFKNHPQLKEVFNMTHQAKGSQPKALATAIFQYARYIEQPEVLKAAIAMIAEKHVSLSVTPTQYEVVGENLLAAIKEVLGDAATPEVLGAWAEAYGQLAQLLIGEEERRYASREVQPGGFRGHKQFVVAKKVKESEVITSLYLQPKDGSPAPAFVPGQYIALKTNIPGEAHPHTRNYSLSDACQPDYLRISVKKEGLVSGYLHDQVTQGDELTVGMPAGVFTLQPSQHPVLLIAGGVGITPLLSMYKTLVKEGKREVVLVQCTQNSEVHAFRDEVNIGINAKAQAMTVYDQPTFDDQLRQNFDFEGFLSAEMLRPLVKTQSEVYLCGSPVFMSHVLGLLEGLGITKDQIFYEFFGPTDALTPATVDYA
ncbi:NO-inducible flavohemoprotein [Microscilla marina]|uniref:nitric oxide dioxygenase n=1 Tax=Microscilla marina ATCC 23134 TaxID=313606 RepID=A1ZE02_MICM2|nr:NO-inducible flavohemoprotein [Microscilla marina]EAY31310.1 flavohemoprotein [Microscilla marina ATCC 23134]